MAFQKEGNVGPYSSVPTGTVPNSLDRYANNSSSSIRAHPMITKQHTTMGFTIEKTLDEDDEYGDRRFECSVCLGEYSESGDGVPRSLMCGHTFCTGCLTYLVKESVISCPKCHHVTPIPSHGVETSLAKNFGVLEIIYSHPSSYRTRQSTSPTPNSSSEAASSNSYSNDQISFTADAPICSIHGDRLTSFCVKDKVLVCSSCLLYGQHKDHPCQLVKDACIEYKQRLKKLIPDVRTKNDQMKAAVVDIGRTIKKVQALSNALGTQVDAHFDELIKVLEERKNELKVEILMRSQTRVEALVEQIHSLEEAVVSGDQCHSEIKESLASDSHQFLQNYSSLSRKILLLFAETAPTAPVAQDDLIVKFPPESLGEDFKDQFKRHGMVQSDVGVVEEILYDSYHDGFRIYWQNQNFVDSDGCTYCLQVATPPDNEYSLIYRGGDTKFTYRKEDLKSNKAYKFRVRVQNLEAVGAWSTPVECYRAAPSWLWDKRRRNFKLDIDSSCLEVSSRYSSGNHWASISGNKVFHNGVFYMEIEIMELAKHHIHKNWYTKIALGLVQCSEASAGDIPWQDGTHPVGQLTTKTKDHHSWGYIVTSGTKVSTTVGMREEEYGDLIPVVVGDRIGMLVEINEHKPSCVSFFCNGNDLGVAYDNLSPPLLPVLSVCDKFGIRLRFPPPPYSSRNPRATVLLNDQCP